jgi:cytochrome c-type biogenesis protein CcmH
MVVTRRLWPAGVVLVLTAIAVAAITLAHEPAQPLSARVDRVAKTLRCPTCAGESVAASDTPIARSMRAEIRHQLQDGRSPDQVRGWFVDRYGTDIVTTPSARGPELLLWALPVVVATLGALIVVVWIRRRPSRASPSPPPGGRSLSGRRVLVAALVCAVAGAAVPAAIALPSGSGAGAAGGGGVAGTPAGRPGPAQWVQLGRSLDRRGDQPGAEKAYRRALTLAPENGAARTRLAFDVLRERRLRAAERLAGPTSRHPGRYRPLALLIVGLAQRGRGEPAASATLRTFLRIAPHHPAAPQVRRLLGAR